MVKGGFSSNKINIWARLVKTVCIVVISVCFVIIVLPGTAVRPFFDDSGSRNSNSSIIKREALPPGSVNETDYFTEDNEYMKDPILIEEGLKHFYELTGVQPYFQLETSSSFHYDDLNIYRNLVAYTRNLYPKLFTDESHLLVVGFADYNSDSGRYEISLCTIVGSKAKTVIDGEAEKILTDCIKFYFNQARWPSEEIFSNAFSDAADRIMGVTPPQSDIPIFITLGVLALLVLLVLLMRIKKKRKLKAQQDKEILSRPLKHYGAENGKRQAAQGNTSSDGAGCDTLPKDEAEILAEKYAARNNPARK